MFFDDLEEIGRAYESKEFMRTVMIKGPYQCGTSVFQLAKLRMLESYYGFTSISADKILSYITWILIHFT